MKYKYKGVRSLQLAVIQLLRIDVVLTFIQSQLTPVIGLDHITAAMDPDPDSFFKFSDPIKKNKSGSDEQNVWDLDF